MGHCAKCGKRVFLPYKTDTQDFCYKCFINNIVEKVWTFCPLCKSTNGFILSPTKQELHYYLLCKSCEARWDAEANYDTKRVSDKVIFTTKSKVQLIETGKSRTGLSLINKNVLEWKNNKPSFEWWVSKELSDLLEKEIIGNLLAGTSFTLFKDENVISEVAINGVSNEKAILTNFRLILLKDHPIEKTVFPVCSHDFCYSIEFTDITSTEIFQNSLKIVYNNKVEEIINIEQDRLVDFKNALDATYKSRFSLINFEDDEKLVYKQCDYSGSDISAIINFWQKIFGSIYNKAKVCITNKRIIFYRIEQIEAISSTTTPGSVLTVPVIKTVFFPIWLSHPSLHFIAIPLSSISKVIFKGMFIEKISMGVVGSPGGGIIEPYSLVFPASLEGYPNAKLTQMKTYSDKEQWYNLDPFNRQSLDFIAGLRQIIPNKISLPDKFVSSRVSKNI